MRQPKGGEAEARDVAELLRSNEALRQELSELRTSHARLQTQLTGAILGGAADRESRRAALNLMEDAVDARSAAQRESEQRRRTEIELREANRQKDGLLSTLAESSARQAFVLELTDRLRKLTEPKAIVRTAIEMLVQNLRVSSAQFANIEADGDAAEMVANHGDGPLSHLVEGAAFRLREQTPNWAQIVRSEGAGFWQGDVLKPALGACSGCAIGFERDGRWVAVLALSHAEPRAWPHDEQWLIRDVAHRIWTAAEQARAELALRASLEQTRTAMRAEAANRAEAEAANRAKDEFLAILSHELRTPLAAILLWAGALQSRAVPIGELARAIDAIAESAEAQATLIEDLLDLTRLASGKLTLACSAVRPKQVAEAALDMLMPMAVKKKIVFDKQIELGEDTAFLDASRFKQILANVLTNAIKFTPESGHVMLSIRRRAGNLEVDVRDDGEGISAEFMPRLFEKFSQADMGETRRHSGLGIGLSLTRQLVELHGGTIEAASGGTGAGALFRIRIPWVLPRFAETVKSRTLAASSRADLTGLRVLLVEDDANTREAMCATLRHAGAIVMPAATADDALELNRHAERVDVIVSDVGLAGTSGIEFIEQVTRECRGRGRPPPPSCAVSAHAREIDRKRAIDAGFDIYIAKPVTPELLIAAVTDLHDIVASSEEQPSSN